MNYSATRARNAHAEFDAHYGADVNYNLGKELFMWLLPLPEDLNENDAMTEPVDDNRDDDDTDDTEDEPPEPPTKKWKESGWTTQSGWESSDQASSSPYPWRKNSWSGAGWSSNKRQRIWAGATCRTCSPAQALFIAVQVPTMVAAMQPVALTATALTTVGVAATAAWYAMWASFSLKALYAFNDISDSIVEGVEVVVVEAAEGSRLVTRCVSIGVMFIAAAAVMMIGYHYLEVLSQWIKGRKRADAYDAKYGRLKGGASKSSYRDLIPTGGLSVADVWGIVNPSARILEAAVQARVPQCPVDPDRLKEGDGFSFCYSRGTRPGLRREVKLVCKLITPTGMQLKCSEIDASGKQIIRNYWPSHTSSAKYDVGEGRDRPSGGSSSTPSSPAAAKEIVKYTAVTKVVGSRFCRRRCNSIPRSVANGGDSS